MALLRIEDVAKRYGTAQALDGVSLDVRRGELLTLLGASGCGKTTLLRVVAGFVAPDRGRVLLEGRDLGAAPPARRGFGFVFQNYALFPTKTVAANVEFGLRVRGIDRRARRARVEALCETVGLAGLEHRYPHELSGGQQQRVALARALAPEPALLLLDEPLSALDARIREKLRDELSRLVRRLGVTAIYVTHDQTEALQLSDRIAMMRGGRVEQLGAPDEIYLRPANRFVAEFVGAVSIVACRRGPGGAPEPAAGAEPALLIALRPEQIELRRDGPGWPATLEHAQFLGHAWRATLRLEDGQSLLADVPAPRWAGLAGAGPLRARIDAEAAATLAQPPAGRRAA